MAFADSFKINVVYNPKLLKKGNIGNTDLHNVIFRRNPDLRKKEELVERLNKKAYDQNLKFQKRKLSQAFNPVFNGYLLFSGIDPIEDNAMIVFGNTFFSYLEESLGIKIIDYSLLHMQESIDDYLSRFLNFEIFNYNFNEHKALKTDFVSPRNLVRMEEFAMDIFLKTVEGKHGKKADRVKTEKKGKPEVIPGEKGNISGVAGTAGSAVRGKKEEVAAVSKDAGRKTGEGKPVGTKNTDTKTDARLKVSSGKEKAAKKSPVVAAKRKIAARKSEPGAVPAENVAVIKENIEEQIKLISKNWSLLSPEENFPVLEKGEPLEIYSGSLIRIYYQKPYVRQVMWRLRQKIDANSRLILRIFLDGDMLWYEPLDSSAGTRYIMFPEDVELYRTWAELGYVTEKGDFVFIARTPVWPPSCLVKKLPKIKSRKIIPGKIALIGGTEGIPGGVRLPVSSYTSGAGLYGSGGSFYASGPKNREDF